MTQFYIQDPSYGESIYLHEILLEKSNNAIYGGAAYAFVSREGVEILLEDDIFKKFLQQGKFQLIVGTDDITNIKTLEELKKIKNEYDDNITIKAYIHDNKCSIFHPKLMWFKYKKGGSIVIGSGNLTLKGLRHNRETNVVVDCDEEQILSIINKWDNWLKHSQDFLFDIENELVYKVLFGNMVISNNIYSKKVKKNEILNSKEVNELIDLYKSQPRNKLFKRAESTKQELPDKNNILEKILLNSSKNEDSYWEFSGNEDMLIAEIPKSGNRWKQANFDKDTFEKFFGATCGENGSFRIILQSVDSDGNLGPAETRPSVSVASRNYRFELDAATGLEYPEEGKRPIAIFIKKAPRDFMYELLMPGHAAYTDVLNFINNKREDNNKLCRLRYNCKEIRKQISNLSIWKYVT